MTNDDIIDRVLNYPLDPVLETYAQRTGKSAAEIGDEAIELKRFLALCTLYPDEELPMLDAADELWHEFICHTALYHRFCHEVAGRYIHHHPYTSDSPPSRIDGEPTIGLYRRHFGDSPLSLAAVGQCNAGKSCSSCKSCRG